MITMTTTIAIATTIDTIDTTMIVAVAIETLIDMSALLAAIMTMIARSIAIVTTRIINMVEATAIKNPIIILD